MNYKCYNHIFKTEKEANQYRNYVMTKLGLVCDVITTHKRYTHRFNMNDYIVEER